MDSYARPQALILLVFAALLTACGGPEERMARAMDRGEEFLAIRDYEKARVEFSNALQVDPNNNDAIYLTGQAAEGLAKAHAEKVTREMIKLERQWRKALEDLNGPTRRSWMK